MSDQPPALTTRSYVLRQGRGTKAQWRALASRGGDYLISGEWLADNPRWADGFDSSAPLIVEIGSGYGEATVAIARRRRQENFLAFEVHQPGVGALINRLDEEKLTNVKIVCDDALRYLPVVADASLAGVHIFFPDPWPKARHRKRRLIRPAIVACLADKLRAGGTVHLMTDWPDYAEQMRTSFGDEPWLPIAAPSVPPTGYQCRAKNLGRSVESLCYRRGP